MNDLLRSWPNRTAAAPDDRLKTREHSGDVVVACMGIALGLGCALFPWYVFFNQDQFGVRAMRFSGEGGAVPDPASIVAQPELVMKPTQTADAPALQLDSMSTGTLPPEEDTATAVVAAEEQPFPGEAREFRLLHIENGRAMIEDADGLWIVQTGSVLPDESRIASIERRDGKWSLVTSANRIITLEP